MSDGFRVLPGYLARTAQMALVGIIPPYTPSTT